MSITSDVYSLGNPGTFDITDKDNPLYYIARYSHECSKNLYDLEQAGWEFEQTQKSEVVTFKTQTETFVSAVLAWYATAVAASEAGTSIPAVPSPPSFPTGTGCIAFQSYLLRVIIQIALMWIRQKLDPDTDSTEISQVLKRAFLGENGSGDEYALIEQMANTPLEIVVSKADGFEDISYADRPET